MSSRSSSAAASARAPSVAAVPGSTSFEPRRSTGSRPRITGAHGSAGRSSDDASPGSSGDASAWARSRSSTSAAVASSHSSENAQLSTTRTASSPSSSAGPSSSAARRERLDADGRVDERANDRRRVVRAEKTVALDVDPAWRRGVEHDGAPDRGAVAQHHPIAPGCDDGGSEPELRVRVPDPDDASGDPAGAVVHGEPCAVRDRRELLEGDLDPVRPWEGAGCDERVAAANLPALDARQADGHPLPRPCARHRRVVHLHGADAHVTPGRFQPESCRPRRSPPTRACRSQRCRSRAE